ncbi:MAG TPA: hypothetical protein VMW16_09215 [Sedimentisphaerales bacterium]|nr:hypothetical protein [Sedimentisphaerales bacterium]
MNRRQKAILTELLAVLAVTAVAVVAMINFKDWVNRSEATGAMKALGEKVLEYRRKNGSVPPEAWVDGQQENLPGYVRLGNLKYRGLWIDSESTADAILAYTEKNYHSRLAGKGYVVLRLDGRVEWLGKQEFEKLLAEQQSPEEKTMVQKR